MTVFSKDDNPGPIVSPHVFFSSCDIDTPPSSTGISIPFLEMGWRVDHCNYLDQ